MNSIPQNNLEQLLEQAIRSSVPDACDHRYALRRALLNSSVFEKNRFRIVWTRLFMYTTSFVAGGAMVAVMVVGVLTIELREGGGSTTVVADIQLPAQAVPEEVPVSITDAFIAESTSSKVEFASFSDHPEVQHILQFTNSTATNQALTR